jgi:tRNA (cytidine/uridine-2'-O-)-methyltransferase
VHVVLVEPEIPPNTGNIARTCAALGAVLHLVEPLGFEISDRHLKRAGVDYWHLVRVEVHRGWEDLPATLRDPHRLHLFTARHGRRYDLAAYGPDPVLVFGRESVGLPSWLLDAFPDRCRVIPMRAGVRSLNLSNAAALAMYEAWRQVDFGGFPADV